MEQLTVFTALEISGFISEKLIFGECVSSRRHPEVYKQKTAEDFTFKASQIVGVSLWRGGEYGTTRWHIYVVEIGAGEYGREIEQFSEPVHVLLEAHGKIQCEKAKKYLNSLEQTKPLATYSAEEYCFAAIQFNKRKLRQPRSWVSPQTDTFSSKRQGDQLSR